MKTVSPRLSYSKETFATWSRRMAVLDREPEAIYVADLCLKTRDGGWSETVFSVFYVEKPRPGYSNHYFGLSFDSFTGQTLIVNADSAAYDTEHKTFWTGVRAEDGEIIFSQWRHNYKNFLMGDGAVDGGQDYFKRVGRACDAEVVRLGLVKGKWVLNPE